MSRLPVSSAVLLFHAFGNNNVKQAALSLAEAGLLEEFWVGFGWNPDHWIKPLLPKVLIHELNRRVYPELVLNQMHNYPWWEVSRLLFQKMKVSKGLSVDMIGVCRRGLDRKVASRIMGKTPVNIVYAYNGSALETFRVAKKLGIKCVYEMASAYPGFVSDIYRRESRVHPTWKGASLLSLSKLQEQVDEELLYADAVVVASSFTSKTLRQSVEVKAPIVKVPYGAPLVEHVGDLKRKPAGKKLKVLYVGNIGLLKGVPYLLEAIRILQGKIDFTLVGMPIGVPDEAMKQIASHTWFPSLANSEILSLMQHCDVLVFPSLSDGFGLVILEALSQGMPVIASESCAAQDVVIDGENGFIIPSCSADAIVEKIEILDNDRELLDHMSKSAICRASDFTWEKYRSGLIGVINSVVEDSLGSSL